MPSVRDCIGEIAVGYRSCVQCQRLKRRDTEHENFKCTNNSNHGKQENTIATSHVTNLERKQAEVITKKCPIA